MSKFKIAMGKMIVIKPDNSYEEHKVRISFENDEKKFLFEIMGVPELRGYLMCFPESTLVATKLKGTDADELKREIK